MKFTIILMLLSVFLTQCETRKEKEHRKENSRFNELWTFYIAGDFYAFYNICPPVSKVFDAGTYDISLEKGDALYFDISPRLNATDPYNTYSYYLGVSKDISSSNIAMNGLGSCNVNKTISNPKPMKTASDSSHPINNSDSEFNYYRYSLAKSYDFSIPITAKAINTSIKFKLKIPEKGGLF